MTLGQNVPKLDALHLMDGIEGLRSLPKHSVDMLLTDPPYGTKRNFWDLPLPEGPNTNLLRLVVMPRFIGRSEMSRCSGFPVSLSTILIPKGDSELR